MGETVTVIPDGQLAFGVQLPVQALSSVVAAPWEVEAGVPELVRAAETADRSGFFYVAICDHVAIPTAFAGPMSTTWFNPVATLGYLAAHTTTARLLTNIYVAPFRHPLDTAKAFATLDTLSGGRVILGVGAGHVPGEFEALGVPFAERGRLLNDAIDGVKESWAAEFVGDVGLRPRPVQQPRPPIWVGGSKPPALRRVAERADGWIPQGTPRADMPGQIAAVLAHRDRVRPGAELELGTITEHLYVGTPDWDVAEPTITGSPAEIAASLNEYGAMGVSHLQVRFRARSIDELCDQLEAFGTAWVRSSDADVPFLTMRHDFRAPAFGPASQSDIYTAALEQYRWADEHGFDFAVLSEHHGLDDGWIPAPLTLAAVIAGATERIPILVSALIIPLHDPVRIAEQLAVLDHASRGRVWTVLGAGYRREEFEMAGVDMKARGKLVEEYAPRVMLDAWTGEPFEWRGRTITVTPRPLTRPHPNVLIGGGTEWAARRAARLHLPMMPMNTDPRLQGWYDDEAAKSGYTEGFVMKPDGPTFVHVTEDPDRAWAQIGEYLLYEAQTYASFQTPGQVSTPRIDAETIDDLRRSPQIVVGTPGEVVAAAERIPATGTLTFNPLAGGLPPELSWPSLELFASAVLPEIRPAT